MSLVYKKPGDLCPTCGRKMNKNGRHKKTHRQLYRCVWCVRYHGTARHVHVLEDMSMTERRIEVLRHVAHGLTHKEISVIIGVSPQTVKNHMCDINKVLNTLNAPHAVYEACKKGLI